MAIHLPPGVRRLEDAEFQRAVYDVMEVIFKINNEMGRLFDEPVYQRAIAHRLESALIEVPLRMSFQSFVKEFVAILRDWGTGLDVHLYEEAVVHFFGGEGRVVQPVEIFDGQVKVGTQRLPVILPGTALRVTTLNRDLEAHEGHLRRFLEHTKLAKIQWVNVGRKLVAFQTLCRK